MYVGSIEIGVCLETFELEANLILQLVEIVESAPGLVDLFYISSVQIQTCINVHIFSIRNYAYPQVSSYFKRMKILPLDLFSPQVQIL